MKKPIIGLVPLFDDEKESLWMLPGYMDGITEAGGIPIILPLTADKAAINQLLDTVDDNSKLIFREFVKHCQEL